MNLKEKWRQTLHHIRNPERDEGDREFMRRLGLKRLLFLLPFIAAALILWLLSLQG